VEIIYGAVIGPITKPREVVRIMSGHDQNIEGHVTGRSLPNQAGESLWAGAQAWAAGRAEWAFGL
jgi:hypothetical protein